MGSSSSTVNIEKSALAEIEKSALARGRKDHSKVLKRASTLEQKHARIASTIAHRFKRGAVQSSIEGTLKEVIGKRWMKKDVIANVAGETKVVLMNFEDLKQKRKIIRSVGTMFAHCSPLVRKRMMDLATQAVTTILDCREMTELMNEDYKFAEFQIENGQMIRIQYAMCFKYLRSETTVKTHWIGADDTVSNEWVAVGFQMGVEQLPDKQVGSAIGLDAMKSLGILG